MSGLSTRREGELFIIQLGSPDEKAVVLTEERMTALSRALDEVNKGIGLRGLLIVGAGPGMFCAGADINVISQVKDKSQGAELAKRGQELFNRIEALMLTTVAAISGPCVGGGFELSLACKYRIAADHPATKIGLPEVKIGILPGFGGTQRLPRLLGIRRALDVILKAKVVPAKIAKSIGLVDHVIEPQAGEDESALFRRLVAAGADCALGKFHPTRRALTVTEKLLTYTQIARGYAEKQAKAALLKETKGFYPAPLKALTSVCNGLKNGAEAGYRLERELLGELIASPECKSLVHVFQISEESGKLSKAVRGNVKGARVSVIGGGVMGSGIAASLLMGGAKVKVVEPIPEVRAKARHYIETALSKKRSLSVTEREEILKGFVVVENVADVAGSDFVIEAIIEDLSAKRELFKKVSELVDSKCIIATNTSSLAVSELADGVSDDSRFIGLHFFNPADRMPLVEIVRGKRTSDRAVLQSAALVSLCGKYPVIVEDVPGFLVNRILTPYLAEASVLLRDGYSVQEIDGAALAFGMPMGPLRLLDEIGLDVAAKVSHILEGKYGERMKGERYAEVLASLGRLGKKSGSGFYIYEGDSAKPDVDIHVKLGLPEPKKHDKGVEVELQDRLILAMVNEALGCLSAGVAGAPGEEAGGQIDLATVMGMGFPPFRGGVIHYAKSVGLTKINEKLSALEKKAGIRFKVQ